MSSDENVATLKNNNLNKESIIYKNSGKRILERAREMLFLESFSNIKKIIIHKKQTNKACPANDVFFFIKQMYLETLILEIFSLDSLASQAPIW